MLNKFRVSGWIYVPDAAEEAAIWLIDTNGDCDEFDVDTTAIIANGNLSLLINPATYIISPVEAVASGTVYVTNSVITQTTAVNTIITP